MAIGDATTLGLGIGASGGEDKILAVARNCPVYEAPGEQMVPFAAPRIEEVELGADISASLPPCS